MDKSLTDLSIDSLRSRIQLEYAHSFLGRGVIGQKQVIQNLERCEECGEGSVATR